MRKWSGVVVCHEGPLADGMFFTLIMTSAVWVEGCLLQLFIGNPKFEPFAMLGGALW